VVTPAAIAATKTARRILNKEGVHVMRLEDYPTQPRYVATVISSEEITEEGAEVEVRELVLEIDQHRFDFEIGQSIGVVVETSGDFGETAHHRLYSVADTPQPKNNPEVTIVVRRCNYIDDYSGEQYIGVTSNFLCDRRPGDKVIVTGPFGMPFKVPSDKSANLLLIGLGTGIAPFRALVKHIYRDVGDWTGKVRLLYGAHSGLELLYMNSKRDDFSNYYDEATFEAFKALSPRPNWADPIAWDFAIEDRADEISKMLSDEHTHIYVAGQKSISAALDELFGEMCESSAVWAKMKGELAERGRWVELLY